MTHPTNAVRKPRSLQLSFPVREPNGEGLPSEFVSGLHTEGLDAVSPRSAANISHTSQNI